MHTPIRVGIVGLEPNRSWAAVAHLPGLRAQPDKFVVAGVANRSAESAQAAARACGIPHAFDSVEELVTSPDIDLVSVTVRVPHHRAVLEQAIAAGKAIYCEWPLARDLTEAEPLVRLAGERGLKTCIGLQGTANPQVRHLAAMLRGGAGDHSIGRVLSHTITGYGRLAGPEITDERTELYLLDKDSGADMLSISAGHTLAVLEAVGGKICSLRSLLATRRPRVFSRERGDFVPMTAPDQIALHGFLEDGAVFALHYRGGLPPAGPGFVWEIEGEEGALRVEAASGCVQIEDLKIGIRAKGERAFRAVDAPQEDAPICPGEFVPGNVGRLYAFFHRELAGGERVAPGFAEALNLHRLLADIKHQALRTKEKTP